MLQTHNITTLKNPSLTRVKLLHPISLIFLITSLCGSVIGTAFAQNQHGVDEQIDRLDIVIEYTDRILEKGIDHWSGESSPLFADGINVYTDEPAKWLHNGNEYFISNMANQQNLFRLFTGLTNLTGDPKYKQAAMESIRYHFDHLLSPSGLLQWGGHQFIDLQTLEPANQGNGFDTYSHEFKNHFPYYDLMREVDPQATTNFLKALWNAHVNDWEVLDMNRHGQWDRPMGALWNNTFTDPEPFFEDRGLTFINAGSDLIYAANALYSYQGEQEALEWANHMYSMYVKARHPETGLGAYQYSKPERREDPPAEGSLEDYTNSRYGDRAENQFGNVYGEVAREGWVLWGGRVKSIYVKHAYMMLGLAETLADEGGYYQDEVVTSLKALAEHAYDPEDNSFRPMWADGTDLSGNSFPRTGYYGEIGNGWSSMTADIEFLLSYVSAYRLSGDEQMWQTARNIADKIGLGDIGSQPGSGVSLNMTTSGNGYHEIYALLELYRAFPDQQYLDRAEMVADQMIDDHFHNGYFMPSEEHVYARFDSIEPLALLALEAVLNGSSSDIPRWNGGEGYIHGNYDGMGRTYDRDAIWSVTVDEVELETVRTIYPSEGEVVSISPEFMWEEVSFANQYQMQLTATNFSVPENILLDSTLASVQLNYPDELNANESYRWRVRAIDQDGSGGPWSGNILFYSDVSTSSEEITAIPDNYRLQQNYPNPFNPETTIQYDLPNSAVVDLQIYDITGREVYSLPSRLQSAGVYTVEFDATSLSSGLYFYRLKAISSGNNDHTYFVQTRKMSLIK